MFTREQEDRRSILLRFAIDKETYINNQLAKIVKQGPPMSPTLKHRVLESLAETYDRLAEPHLNAYWAAYNAGNKFPQPTGILA